MLILTRNSNLTPITLSHNPGPNANPNPSQAWLICEHNSRGYDAPALSNSFSLMYFGNSICAICAGLVAEAAADLAPLTAASATSAWHYGGNTAPFDLSAGFLLLCLVLVSVSWTENYGEPRPRAGSDEERQRGTRGATSLEACSSPGFGRVLVATLSDPTLVLCGVAVALFEGSMYIFVFNWTPALSAGHKDKDSPPFGFIFATFMVACMGGSSAYALLSHHVPIARLLAGVFAAAAVALVVPVVTSGTLAVLLACMAFEACVGVYFPAMGTLKSRLVPEETRATIYNIYRIPLNAVVLGVLLSDIGVATAFGCCVGLLAVCAIAQHFLARRLPANQSPRLLAVAPPTDGVT